MENGRLDGLMGVLLLSSKKYLHVGYCLLFFSVHIPCFQYQTVLPSLQLAIFSGQLEGPHLLDLRFQ